MTISRNISVMAQGASSSGILAGGYGGLGASISPTTAGNVVFTTNGTSWSSTAKIVQGTTVQNGLQLITGLPITLSGVLDRVQLIATNNTDTFDAGSVNILYE